MIQHLINLFRKTDVRYRQTQIGGVPIYADDNAATYLKCYMTNPAVYSIVSASGKKFSTIPRHLYKIEDEGEYKKYSKIKLHNGANGATGYNELAKIRSKAYSDKLATKGSVKELNDLLMRPNPIQGQDGFLFACYVSYKIFGECYIWINRGDIDGIDDIAADKVKPVEMWVLPPHLLELIPDKDDVWAFSGYRLNINGTYAYIRKSDVITWKNYNPNFDAETREHLRGLSPLKPALRIIKQNESATDATVAMYQSGGARGILFEKALTNVTATQQAQIKEIVNNRINNKDVKSAVASIQGDWGYIDIGSNAVDLQLLQGEEMTWKKLCNVIGWQYELFQSDTTFANKEQAWKFATVNIILPDCAAFQDELNRVLLPIFGIVGHAIDIDYSELPELQDDIAKMVTYLKDAPITPNEFREALGYDPLDIEGMDNVYMPTSSMPIDELKLDYDISRENSL